MATKSILKNVNIKGRSQVKNLANALEYAETRPAKIVTLSKALNEVKGENVKKFFGVV